MVGILYRGEHRIINFILYFAAARCAVVLAAGNLQNSALWRGAGYCARLSLSALWCEAAVATGPLASC